MDWTPPRTDKGPRMRHLIEDTAAFLGLMTLVAVSALILVSLT